MQKDVFTLEELAAATGMTARNVRAYQTKGLVPAPWRSGRRSAYGAEHLQRLQAIEQARRQGASLTLIAAHLASGRALDDDTLVGWSGTGPHGAGAPQPLSRAAAGAGERQDIAPLLAQLDIQRDANAQADVDDLMAAGVLRPDGGRIYTGRELAQSLRALQQRDFPLQVALGIAQRTLTAATPMATVLREFAETADGITAVQGHLGEVACYVLRHLINGPPAGDGAPEPTP